MKPQTGQSGPMRTYLLFAVAGVLALFSLGGLIFAFGEGGATDLVVAVLFAGGAVVSFRAARGRQGTHAAVRR